MQERTLKYLLGTLLVLSHFGLLVYAGVLYFRKGFRVEDFTTVVAILAPIFAGYTTSILTFVIRDGRVISRRTARVSVAYCIFSIGIPTVLVAGVAICMHLWAVPPPDGVFESFEDFKRFLLLLESVFGAYVGMFVYSLFTQMPPVGLPPANPAPAAPPTVR